MADFLNFNMGFVDKAFAMYQQAKADRTGLDAYWKQLYKYAQPEKDDITGMRNPAERLATDVYDDTAINAITISAAGLHGYLTNPAQRWFVLEADDMALREKKEVKTFMKDLEDEMYNVLNHSNNDTELPSVYADLLTIGCTDLFEEEDPDDVVRFFTNSMYNTYFVENDRKIIDTVFREVTFTTLQAIEKFKGDNLPIDVIKAYNDKKYSERFRFIVACLPRESFNPYKIDSSNMPYASLWIYEKDKKLVRESGYQVFPHMCPRFYADINGSPYGRSPLMRCLPGVSMMQSAERSMLISTELAAQPTIFMPHKNFSKPIRFKPGAINYDLSTDAAFSGKQIQFAGGGGNIAIGEQSLDARRTRINRGLFAELFLFVANAQGGARTATEINAKVNESMLLLGSAVGRFKRELLIPKIARTYSCMAAQGRIPKIPDVLQGKSFMPRFTSPLAKVQTSVEMNETINFVELIGQMQNFFPQAPDLLNVDFAVKKIHSLKSIDPRLLNSDEDVEMTRTSRQEAEIAAAQQNEANVMAQTAKVAAEAEAAGRRR